MDTENQTVETQATTKLKKGDIIERYNMLKQPLNLKGVKLLYTRDRNLTKLAALAADGKDLSFNKRFPKSEAYKEYQEKQRKMFEELSKDKDGNPKTKMILNPATKQETEVFDVDLKSEKYLKANAKLEKEYADAIKELAENQEKYIDFLNEDFEEEINFLKVSLEEVNEDISEFAFAAISWMIKDE